MPSICALGPSVISEFLNDKINTLNSSETKVLQVHLTATEDFVTLESVLTQIPWFVVLHEKQNNTKPTVAFPNIIQFESSFPCVFEDMSYGHHILGRLMMMMTTKKCWCLSTDMNVSLFSLYRSYLSKM